MDYHELQKSTVVKLREMAQEYEDITGAVGKTKEELVDILADKLGIEKPHLEIVGINKAKVKSQIKALKVERDKALEAKDQAELKRVRRKIHKLRHKLRSSAHLT